MVASSAFLNKSIEEKCQSLGFDFITGVPIKQEFVSNVLSQVDAKQTLLANIQKSKSLQILESRSQGASSLRALQRRCESARKRRVSEGQLRKNIFEKMHNPPTKDQPLAKSDEYSGDFRSFRKRQLDCRQRQEEVGEEGMSVISEQISSSQNDS